MIHAFVSQVTMGRPLVQVENLYGKRGGSFITYHAEHPQKYLKSEGG